MECKDKNCPAHGALKTRGAVFEGVVVSTKPKNTAVVRRDYHRKVQKYDRLEKRKSRLSAHLPPCMSVEVGDKVIVMECRKVSKTKNHVVIQNKSKSESK